MAILLFRPQIAQVRNTRTTATTYALLQKPVRLNIIRTF